jgi:glutamate-1-semialdehyde 2,1-aminomutase
MRELNDRGDRLRARLNKAAGDTPMVFTGRGSMATVHFTDGPVRNAAEVEAADARLKELFYFDLLRDGCYLARRGMLALSLAITDADCDTLIAAVDRFVDRRADLLAD